MPAAIPIGTDTFRRIREDGLEYIDKTKLIQEILDDVGTTVLLLPRPRRFGKTVNMTMLESFLAKSAEDLSHLFEGLYIWSVGGARPNGDTLPQGDPRLRRDHYLEHFQRYPTIFLTFKNVKPENAEHWRDSVRHKVSALYDTCADLPEQARLSPMERADFAAVLERRADDVVLAESLFKLSEWLHRAYGERVLILVDEYDTPIHAAWNSRCYEPVVNFFRAFFGAALKGNSHLFKGVLTGILRVSKESIFSDLNNPKVKTVLDPEFSDAFGFTETEVHALCERQGQQEYLPIIQQWYNGYRFGGRVMYNPWSVLNFLDSREKSPQSYWLTSSSNDLIKELLSRRTLEVHEEFQTLLEGGSIDCRIEPNLVFSELEHSQDALYTLLLFSGYLKAERLPAPLGEKARYALSIPNREVMEVYHTVFKGWLQDRFGGSGEQVKAMVKAILTGDADRLEELLGKLSLTVLSTQDGTKLDPEALYHGLMLGLCATLEPEYRVMSNRESGTGRPDLMILPARAGQPGRRSDGLGRAGAVLELKVAKKKRTLDQALAEGEAQLTAQQYDAELEAVGANPIQRWAVAFNGKTVKVKRVEKDGSRGRS